MEVPDNTLNDDLRLSPTSAATEAIGEYAAKMSTPGAAISGCGAITNVQCIRNVQHNR